MRILKLTPSVQRQLLAARSAPDAAALRVVKRIIADVKRRGDSALFAWTKKLDALDLHRRGVWIGGAEIAAARREAAPEFLRAVEHAAANVRQVAEKQLPQPWTIDVEPGVRIGQLVRPIDSIGCYVPGGRFALISTMIMTVVPAQVAGVPSYVVACPKPNRELLAAASLLGVTQIAQIGGAQAIAALAYGTKFIPRVEKIFGPGNRFVTAAKQLVANDCAIDLPAGPTEAIVLAERGNPRWIAADLIAQAEHAPDAASFLVTPSSSLAHAVQREIREQLKLLPPVNPAHQSLRRAGAILVAVSLARACEFVNEFAPEHLSLPDSASAGELLNQVRAAGTIFVGPWAAQPLGDYASGSNHVLPTAGWARRRGGLSAADFVKCISVQSIDATGFANLAADVQRLARAEGLLAHANAIEVRR
jgi:histidinol dehydrogenase